VCVCGGGGGRQTPRNRTRPSPLPPPRGKDVVIDRRWSNTDGDLYRFYFSFSSCGDESTEGRPSLHTHTHARLHTHTRTRAHAHTRTHTHTHTRTHTHTHTVSWWRHNENPAALHQEMESLTCSGLISIAAAVIMMDVKAACQSNRGGGASLLYFQVAPSPG